MNRRGFLRIAGSAGVILAAGSGVFVATRTPHAALKPWHTAGSRYPDPMRRALSYAILAPNPHNRQPWLVDLKSDTEAVLSCDVNRLLPATDPYDRQIVIGLGCFLELFAIAASHDGYRANIELFPQGEPGTRIDGRPIARLRLEVDPGVSGDPLFAQVLERRTNRGAYDTVHGMPEEALESIVSAAGREVSPGITAGGPLVQELRVLTREALRGELMDPAAYQESVDLMRIGRAEIEASPDGISLDGPFLETLHLVGMLTRETLADRSSSAFQFALDMADEQANTAAGFVWLNTESNSRRNQVAAGRSYARLALQATAEGVAMQPMSQALQEYPAMRPYLDKAHELLATSDGERVQMLARIGYAPAVAPSPRWPLSTRVEPA